METFLPARHFQSLSQRMVYAYLATMPPTDCQELPRDESHQQFFAFVRSMLQRMHDDPACIGLPDAEDDCFGDFKLKKTNPALDAAMRKSLKGINDFVLKLVQIGREGETLEDGLFVPSAKLRFSKTLIERLERFSLRCEERDTGFLLRHPEYPRMSKGWKDCAAFEDQGKTQIEQVMTFLHGRGNGLPATAVSMFGGICGDRAGLVELEAFFVSQGYAHEQREFGIYYEKQFPKGDRGYLRVYYNWHKERPVLFEIKVPRFREILGQFESLHPRLQEFLLYRLKTCDGCGYCNQTNKARPILAMDLSFQDKRYTKCPLYPLLAWHEVSDDMRLLISTLFELSGTLL